METNGNVNYYTNFLRLCVRTEVGHSTPDFW